MPFSASRTKNNIKCLKSFQNVGSLKGDNEWERKLRFLLILEGEIGKFFLY